MRKTLCFSLLSLTPGMGLAATYVASGAPVASFNSSADWTPAIPGTNTTGGPEVGSGLDDATIPAGFTREYTNGFNTGNPGAANDFSVAGGSVLTVDGGTLHKTGGGNWTRIGDANGTGTVAIQNGGTYQMDGTSNLVLGPVGGSTGTITVDGAGSNLSTGVGGNNKEIVVGREGTGVLTVSNGGVVNSASDDFRIGENGGSTGTASFDATSTLNHTASGRHVQIGQNGTGTLNMDGTMTSQAQVNIGNGGGSVGNYTLGTTGTHNQLNQSFLVAANGTGTYTLQGQHNQNAGNFVVANNTTGIGTVIVDGGTLDVSNPGNQREIIVGNNGTGTMNIINGGTVNSDDDDFRVAPNGGSTGTVNIGSGGVLNHTPASNRWFQHGTDGDATMNVNAGGTFNANTTVRLAGNAGSSGTLNINGGTVNLTGPDFEMVLGTTTVTQTAGTFNIANNWDLDNGGTGTVNLTGGMIMVGGNILDRDGDTLFGIDGATLSAANILFNAADGTDTLSVSGGSSVTVANDLTVINGDTMKFILGAGPAGFNPIVVGGNTNFAGAIGMFDVSNWGGGWVPYQTEIPLIDIAGGGSNGSAGIFDNFGELAVVGSNGPVTFQLSRLGGDGNNLVLIAVPEPTRSMLLAAGLGCFLLRRRR